MPTGLRLSRSGLRALWLSDDVGDAMVDASVKIAYSIRRQRRGHVTSVGRRKPGPWAADSADVTDGARTGRIDMNDPGWALLEYGTMDMAPERPVMRGVEAAGARWEDTGP